jgi:hypothetical protein
MVLPFSRFCPAQNLCIGQVKRQPDGPTHLGHTTTCLSSELVHNPLNRILEPVVVSILEFLDLEVVHSVEPRPIRFRADRRLARNRIALTR